MKKILAILLVVVLVASVATVAVSAYSTTDPDVPFAKDAIKQYDEENGTTTPTYTYYFLEPDGKSGRKGTDPESAYCGQFAPSWFKGEWTQGGPGCYWWDITGVANPSGWCGYKVDGLVEGTQNVWKCTVPQAVTTILWSNGVDGGTDPLEPCYYEAAQSNNVPSEYYDPGEQPLIPEGTDNFDGMIWVVNPDIIEINELSGMLSCGGSWFYYYGNDCFGCVKGGESDLEANCMNEAHHHGEPAGLKGDADDNGAVDVMDATCIQKYLVQLTDKINLENADTKSRGVDQIDIMDASNIQKFLVQLSNIDGSTPYDPNYPINPKS